MKIFKLAYVLPILVLFSCKKSDDAPTPILANQWYSYKAFADDTVDVKNGFLYMSTKYGSSSSGASSVVSFGKLKGDFELRIKYSSASMSGTSTFSESLLFGLFQPGVTKALVGGVLTNEIVYVGDSTTTFPDMQSTSAREGEFYVKREGSKYTSWMRAGADTSFLNKTNYVTSDLSLTMAITSNDVTVTRTSVHIDDVSIQGGGGAVRSDPFDENYITAY